MKKFFIWCSGVSHKILEMCDHKEQVKYVNIGIIVFAVAVLSTLSSAYFLSFAFNTTNMTFNWLYFPIGIIWGAIILSLDRGIVSTINKKDNLTKQIFKAIPRFLLAFTIGLIVSTPIEFKIFQKEINTILYNESKEIVINKNKDKFEDEISLWKNKVEQQRKIYSRNKLMYANEVSGKKSGIPGKGPRANEYMRMEINSLKLLNAYKDSLQLKQKNYIIFKKNLDLDSLTNLYMIKNIGVLQRTKVLYSLGYLHTFITFLFILIETLPVLIKIMSPKGSYDDIYVLEHELHIKQVDKNLQLSILQFEHDITLEKQKLENNVVELNNKHNNDLKLQNRLFENTLDKKEIELNNELRLHEFKINKEFEDGKNKLNNENLIESIEIEKEIEQASEVTEKNTVTNEVEEENPITNIQLDNIQIENRYWKNLKNNIIYYFKQNDNKSLQKTLLIFDGNDIINGNWRYKIDGDYVYIIMSIKNRKYKLKYGTVTSNTLILYDNDVKLEFKKIVL